MNWKSEAIDKLKNYEARKKSIEDIPLEIERLKCASTSVRSATTDGAPAVSDNGRREDVLLSNIVHREELNRSLKQAKLWVKFVDEGLSVLTDEEKLVLDLFYIHPVKDHAERLCKELKLIDERSVYKRKDKALRHFTMALYGVVES